MSTVQTASRQRFHYADIVLLHGNVITMDTGRPRATSVAIKDDRFVAVGAEHEVEHLAGPGTVKIDLRGRTVTPGLIDGHAHLDREGLKYLYPSLGGARSVEDVLVI